MNDSCMKSEQKVGAFMVDANPLTLTIFASVSGP